MISSRRVLPILLLAAAVSCGGGNSSTTPAEAPEEAPAATAEAVASEPDPAPTATVPAAQFAIPEGYELRPSSADGQAMLAGESGMVIVTDGESPGTLGELEGCLGFADGYAAGYLTGIMDKEPGSMKVVSLEGTAFGNGGCRSIVAPAAGKPAVLDVVALPFGERVVVVMCSVRDEAQARACATVQGSVKPR